MSKYTFYLTKCSLIQSEAMLICIRCFSSFYHALQTNFVFMHLSKAIRVCIIKRKNVVAKLKWPQKYVNSNKCLNAVYHLRKRCLNGFTTFKSCTMRCYRFHSARLKYVNAIHWSHSAEKRKASSACQVIPMQNYNKYDHNFKLLVAKL